MKISIDKKRFMVIFCLAAGLLLVLACSISPTPPNEGKSSESTAEETSPKPNGNDSESSKPQAGFPSGSDFTYINWKCEEEHAPAELPVGIGYKWLAKTAQQVQDYLDAVTHQVEVNGSPYASPPIFSEITENEDGNFYSQVYIYFGDLKPGKYEFQTFGSFTEKVFDGEYWSGPGTENPTFEGSCTLIVEADSGQMAVEPQPQGQSEGNKESVPQSQQQPAGPKEEPPLTFTYSPIFAPIGSEVTINLSRPANVEVYFEGISVAKKTSSDGKTLTATVPPGFSCGYIELKGEGLSVRSDKVLFSDNKVLMDFSISFAFFTDLAVTDLYPDNQPIGEVYARITNRGPLEITETQVDLDCEARLEPQPVVGVINTKKQIKLSIKPGETKIFDTGIHTETDAFKYSIKCTVRPHTNSYTGIFNKSLMPSPSFSGSFTCPKNNVTMSFNDIDLIAGTDWYPKNGTSVPVGELKWDNNTYFERIP